MIRINLLPEELRGRGKRVAAVRPEGVSPLIILAILLMVAIDAGAFWYVVNRAKTAEAKSKAMTDELAARTKERDEKMPEYQTLLDLREQLQLKEAILKALDPPDRILWSEKLNMLCYIVHPQVFITNVKLDEKIDQEETPTSIKRREDWAKTKQGTQPAKVMVPIITQTMVLTGITTGDTNRQRFDNYIQFLTDLSTYQTKDNAGKPVKFLDGFSGPPQLVGQGFLITAYEGKTVGQFTLQLTTVPMRGEIGA